VTNGRACASRRRAAPRASPHATINATTTTANVRLARDVTFDIAPKLQSEALPAIPTLKMFDPNGGIAALPPGKRITTAFDLWPQRVTRADLPDTYEAIAQYNGDPYRFLFWQRQKHYRDPPLMLDLGVYRDSIPEQRKDVHDIHAVLVKIEAILRKRSTV